MKRTMAVAPVLFAAALSSVALQQDTAAPLTTDVFVAGTGGYHTYRIPSAIVAPQGHCWPLPKDDGREPPTLVISTSSSGAVTMADAPGRRYR